MYVYITFYTTRTKQLQVRFVRHYILCHIHFLPFSPILDCTDIDRQTFPKKKKFKILVLEIIPKHFSRVDKYIASAHFTVFGMFIHFSQLSLLIVPICPTFRELEFQAHITVRIENRWDLSLHCFSRFLCLSQIASVARRFSITWIFSEEI